MPSAPEGLLAKVRGHGDVPRHVAIIMDGNGRWARGRRLPRVFGHRSGMSAVREVIEGSVEAGIEFLSLFAFSQENWERPTTEVAALMDLLVEYVGREAEELTAKGVQVRVLGDLSRLTPAAAAAVAAVVERTAGNRRLVLNLFISYGARNEIVRAARALAREAVAGRLDPESITEEMLSARLYTADCPDPDLLIRTSGEQRISNFLLWQLAYSELYITKVLWPDFTRAELFGAIAEFQRRDRRYGRVTA
ncbi:MAG TPA: isoprenyl transferase [Gemmatimonadaceae bacterium]